MKDLRIGQVVKFVDSSGFWHDALVTAIHGDPEGNKLPEVKDDDGKIIQRAHTSYPCLNLVHVVEKEGQTDQYGRQTERNSSVMHYGQYAAAGFCWSHDNDEDIDAMSQSIAKAAASVVK